MNDSEIGWEITIDGITNPLEVLEILYRRNNDMNVMFDGVKCAIQLDNKSDYDAARLGYRGINAYLIIPKRKKSPRLIFDCYLKRNVIFLKQ